jgi:hypothetical protein
VDDGDPSSTTNDSLSDARKLVIRMGDLEERLICDEIQIQHLSMEAFSVEHEGDAMVTHLQAPSTKPQQLRPPRKQLETTKIVDSISFNAVDIPSPSHHSSLLHRELSGISWGSGSNLERFSQRSFLLYEKNDRPLVRIPEEHLPLSQVDTPVAPLDGYFEAKNSHPVMATPLQHGSPASPSSQFALADNPKSRKDPDGSYESSNDMHDAESEQKAIERGINSSPNRGEHPINVDILTSALYSPRTPDARKGDTIISESRSELKGSHWSPSAKVVRFSPTQLDDPSKGSSSKSRSQKLLAAKKKRFLLRLSNVDDRLTIDRQQTESAYVEPRSGLGYHNLDRTSQSFVGQSRAATSAASFSESTGSAVSSPSVFRPLKTINFGYHIPHRELSTLTVSSDRSNASDVYNAQRVREIEELISKYTTEARDLSRFDEV